MTTSAPYRKATAADAATIAALHADSWRRHYRHSYPETFFGASLDEDRLAVWTDRLRGASGSAATVIAEAPGGVGGFVHVMFDDDATWGALVDNLHVRHDLHRHGIATQLMTRAASLVAAATPRSGLYLWVLEQNVRAQAFYRSVGGRDADRRPVEPPALPGTRCIRYVWPEQAVLAGLLGTDAAGS